MKKKKYTNSIENKLLTIILLITSVSYLIAYTVFSIWYIHNQEEEKEALAKTITHVLGQDFAKLILLNDVSTAADITTKLNSFHSIDSITLYRKNKTAIYQYKAKKTDEKAKNILTISTPAIYSGTKLGSVLFHMKIETFQELFVKDLPFLTSLYLFMIFISYFLAKYYALKFTEPILKLVKFLEKVDLTKSSYKEISIMQDNEYGKLYQEVNTMLQNIQKSTKEQKIAAVAFDIQNAIIITDENMKVIKVNQSFINITQYTLLDIIGKLPPVLQHNYQNNIYREIMQSLEKNSYWSGEIINQRKDKKLFYENLVIQKVLDSNHKTTHYVFSFSDLTEQKETEKRLQNLIQYDPLTGLANKELFLQNLQEKIDTETTDSWHVLFCIDIKNFKIINDVYGYEYGDLLLKKVADRLKKDFKESDFIAKIGIDEFILSYRNLSDTKVDKLQFVQTIAEYITTILNQNFLIKNQKLNIMSRIGIELYNNEIDNADIILKQADTALQLAKEKDVSFAFFNKEFEKSNIQHLHIYNELLRAIKEQEFELFYQLQFNDKEEITGAEALIRWNHPTNGYISPDNFIPIAEKTGLILPIGKWVIEEGCRQLKEWQNNPKTEHWILAINVSAKQFSQKNFVDHIKENVLKNNISYTKVKIELVESLLIEDMHEVITKMGELRELGIALSMDDFGTGYSSLEYLKNLPLNQIKIDQSFVMNMLHNEKDKAIVKSIIALGQGFSMEVIAEGVETYKDFQLLKELSCNHYQGYYFAKPHSIEYINKNILADD